jgi:hypothetical protein
MTNSKKIDDERYADVKGEPYLFKEWRYGRTINSKSETVDSILMNYNGETHNMEIKNGSSFIELDAYHYPLVIIYGENGEDLYFRRSSSRSLLNRYPRLVYNGDEITVVQDFNSRIETKRVNDVGKIRETKSFVNRKNYYIIQYNKAKLLKLKKGNLLKILGHKDELEKYIKEEKIKINEETDLVKLLKFYEDRGYSMEELNF